MTEISSAAQPDAPLSKVIGDTLPFLRRHARALTGSQTSGDRYAGATLEAVLNDPAAFRDVPLEGRGALFSVFYRIWQSTGEALDEAAEANEGARSEALRHLARLTPRSREALLLHTVEDFTLNEVASILNVDVDEASHLVETARNEMYQSVKGRVMVIEDESVIAMDLEGIVEMMGHDVTGVATTADQAVQMGKQTRPDLILADIQLADGSSGIDAVLALLAEFGDLPVIFVTAFPERLLTGDRPEPAFLIAKPYTPAQVMSAVSQAMFFASTETLKM